MVFIRKYALLISLFLIGLFMLAPIYSVARDRQTYAYTRVAETGDSSLIDNISVSGIMLHQTRGPAFSQHFSWQSDQFSLTTRPLLAREGDALSRKLNPYSANSGLNGNQFHYQLGSFQDTERQTWMIIRRYPYSGRKMRAAYVPVHLKDNSHQSAASGIWSPFYILTGNHIKPLAEYQNNIYGFVPALSGSSGKSSLFRVDHFEKDSSQTYASSDTQPPDSVMHLTDLPLDEDRNLIALYVHQDALVLISTYGAYYEPAEKTIEVTRYSLTGDWLASESIKTEFTNIYHTSLQNNTLMLQTQGSALKAHLFQIDAELSFWGSVDLTSKQLMSSLGLAVSGYVSNDFFYLAEALEYRPELPDETSRQKEFEQLTVSYPDGYSQSFTNWQQAEAARLMPRSSVRLSVYNHAGSCLYEGFFDFGVNDDYLYRLHQDRHSYQQSEPERRYMQIEISYAADE